MTAWLIRRFVKDYENTENGEVRAAYGTLGSCVGHCWSTCFCLPANF